MPSNGYSINPSAGSSITYLDRKLYMHGTDGENSLDSNSKFNYAFKIYDLDSQTWTLNYTANTNTTLAFLGHNLINLNETLYLIGGYYSLNGIGNKEIFEVNLADFSTYSIPRQGTSSLVRAYTTVVQYNNSLIVSGGRSESEIQNEILQIFISPYSFKVLSKEILSPQARKNSVIINFSSYIYLFAGSTSSS